MKKKGLFFTTGLLSIGFAVGAQAGFDGTFVNARAAAMAGSFMASLEDSTAVFANPAGLGNLAAGDISLLGGKDFIGLPGIGLGGGQICASLPFLSAGQLGLGYSLFEAQDIRREQVFALGYGAKWGTIFQAGLTAKYLWQGYLVGSDPLAASDPIFKNGTSKSAMTVDAGILAELAPGLSLGLAGRNLTGPNLGLVSEDVVPLQLQAGLLWNWAEAGAKVALDVLLQGTDPVLPALGLEKLLAGETVALRLGVSPLELTGGFGVRWSSWSLDYAAIFKLNLLSDNAGSHQLGLTYHFEAPVQPAAKPAKKTAKKASGTLR